MKVELADGLSLFVREAGEGFPVVILHGGPGLDHTHVPPRAMIDGSELALPQAGDMSFVEAPVAYFAAVRAFLRRAAA